MVEVVYARAYHRHLELVGELFGHADVSMRAYPLDEQWTRMLLGEPARISP